MNKILFFLSFALLSLSCNDDDVAPAQEASDAFVTRISRDGVTALELFYDVEKKLYRVNYYFSGNLSSYMLYEYDENGLKELRRYDADDHSLNYRTVFTLDNFGRVIKGENYSKPDFLDEPASLSEFEYNGSGQLTVREFRSAGEPVYSREEYTYDADGNLIEQQRTHYPNQEEEYLNSISEYTPRGQPIPGSWENYIFILGISGLDYYIRDMFISNFHYKGWGANGTLEFESTNETSEHVFDEDGNLTAQVVTRKNLENPQSPDVVDMTYDYKE